MKEAVHPRRWIMWVVAALFVALQFMLRVSPGAMVEDLMVQLHADASIVGTLSAAYYVAYAGMQIPVGYILDRFGPRYVVSSFAGICAVGVLLFMQADNLYLAVLGRFLIGFGSSAAVLSTFKVGELWFPRHQYGLVVGATIGTGLIGAIGGGAPVRYILDRFGMNATYTTLALACVLMSVALVMVLRNRPSESRSHDPARESVWGTLVEYIFSNPKIWLLGLYGGLLVGALEGFSDAWGAMFLQAKGFSEEQSSWAVTMVFIGMAVGSPIIGYIAGRLKMYLGISVILSAIMAGGFFFLIFIPSFPYWVAVMMLALIGIGCAYQVLTLGVAPYLVPDSAGALATAFVNALNMAFGSFFHIVIGWLLTYYWDGAVLPSGAPLYDVQAFQKGLLVIPISCLLGGAGLFFMTLGRSKIVLAPQEQALI